MIEPQTEIVINMLLCIILQKVPKCLYVGICGFMSSTKDYGLTVNTTVLGNMYMYILHCQYGTCIVDL